MSDVSTFVGIVAAPALLALVIYFTKEYKDEIEEKFKSKASKISELEEDVEHIKLTLAATSRKFDGEINKVIHEVVILEEIEKNKDSNMQEQIDLIRHELKTQMLVEETQGEQLKHLTAYIQRHELALAAIHKILKKWEKERMQKQGS